MIKWAFFGADDFSVTALEELISNGFKPRIIVTMPDAPAGRKQTITPPLIKEWALKKKIEVFQPDNLKDFALELKDEQWDLFVIASYGKILPQCLLDAPKSGVINMHPSLLPLYRGPSPIETAILDGVKETGVTIMLVDEKMDHGAVLIQEQMTLRGDEWYPELAEILAKKGGRLTVEIIPLWIDGKITAEKQDDKKATYTKMIKKEDGFIDLKDDSAANFRKIRAFEPWPRTYFITQRSGKDIRVVISLAHMENNQLIIDRVIPAGSRQMKYSDFLKGLR